MSKETMEWLNTKTLIGNTSARGTAWHYRLDDQGDELNHYERWIPSDDVIRRLFSWEPLEGNVCSEAAIISEDGAETVKVVDESRKAIIRPPGALSEIDEGGILGVFKQGYQPHSYKEWLIDNVGHILDDNLGITSAGLLAMGGQAWVEVSVPESIKTPEGVEFLPNLLATTSLDGTLATTYKRSINNVVCDNTRAMVLAGAGETHRTKHTKNSNLKILEAREALSIVHTMADDFTAEVDQLCNTTVTDSQWEKFLDDLVPLKENGEEKTGTALTRAQNKRGELWQMWTGDDRVAPWKNTAHGVLQAVNTWSHHKQSFKGSNRGGRNMAMAIKGDFDKLDQTVKTTLDKVLA